MPALLRERRSHLEKFTDEQRALLLTMPIAHLCREWDMKYSTVYYHAAQAGRKPAYRKPIEPVSVVTQEIVRSAVSKILGVAR